MGVGICIAKKKNNSFMQKKTTNLCILVYELNTKLK